ncbi:hypothetical protein BKA70DRAFT_1425720 [Coprinopsis sp. MPI-PUGE-AT-0042]|nr:hypothetical protein BKA70DRAFT_1425720 [Coprinopsis sp. MPI-PUGE-AT-0042]
MTLPPSLSLSLPDAQKVVDKHLSSTKVVNVKDVHPSKFSLVHDKQIYLLEVESETKAQQICFLTLALPTSSVSSTGHLYTLSLQTVHVLLDQIQAQTSIPNAKSILDTTHSCIPYDLLLSSPITLSSSSSPSSSASTTVTSLSSATNVPPNDLLRLHLSLGTHLASLHTNVQNDWFGAPGLRDDEGPNSISWQETFVSLFESAVQFVRDKEDELGLGSLVSHEEGAEAEALPYQDLQIYMSRAIAFFLFDDVEVPSLVWLTGNEEDVYVSVPAAPSPSTTEGELAALSTDPQVIALLPTLSHALWGDPLLESLFISLSSSSSPKSQTLEALLEGYALASGPPLISFPRQRTKRLWYTIYLCFLVLGGWHSSRTTEGATGGSEGNAKWARGMILDCVKVLKDSPCY